VILPSSIKTETYAEVVKPLFIYTEDSYEFPNFVDSIDIRIEMENFLKGALAADDS